MARPSHGATTENRPAVLLPVFSPDEAQLNLLLPAVFEDDAADGSPQACSCQTSPLVHLPAPRSQLTGIPGGHRTQALPCWKDHHRGYGRRITAGAHPGGALRPLDLPAVI
ncbi:hypothetical protein [Streptomyces sp. NPDC059753]|uniref:hypothetical protein n=1 Tax=Streptomyces sp. NPDC059753 TaxID=3346933 RepID=UPI00365B5412